MQDIAAQSGEVVEIKPGGDVQYEEAMPEALKEEEVNTTEREQELEASAPEGGNAIFTAAAAPVAVSAPGADLPFESAFESSRGACDYIQINLRSGHPSPFHHPSIFLWDFCMDAWSV